FDVDLRGLVVGVRHIRARPKAIREAGGGGVGVEADPLGYDELVAVQKDREVSVDVIGTVHPAASQAVDGLPGTAGRGITVPPFMNRTDRLPVEEPDRWTCRERRNRRGCWQRRWLRLRLRIVPAAAASASYERERER